MISYVHHLRHLALTEIDVRNHIKNAEAHLASQRAYSHSRLLQPSENYPYYVIMSFWKSRAGAKNHLQIFDEVTK